jgi:hypothetical protein
MMRRAPRQCAVTGDWFVALLLCYLVTLSASCLADVNVEQSNNPEIVAASSLSDLNI